MSQKFPQMHCSKWTVRHGGLYLIEEVYPGGSEVKASTSSAGDPGSIPGSGRSPWTRDWQSIPVISPIVNVLSGTLKEQEKF